jgi:hypothetical protein
MSSENAGLRDDVTIMIGGGAVTDHVREYSGAKTYCKDAVEGVNLSKKCVEKRISDVNNSFPEQINWCVFNCH